MIRRSRTGLLLAPVIASLAGMLVAPVARADAGSPGRSGDDVVPAGSARPRTLQHISCAVVHVVPHACSHGADSRGALGLTSPAQPWDTAAAKRGGRSSPGDYVPLRCASGEGNRIQVLYAHASGRGRLSRVLPQLDRAVAEANGIFFRSAQQTRGSRQLAVLTRRSGKHCSAAVTAVVVSSKALNDFSALVGELQSRGFTRDDRKYLVFGDGTTSFCGIATLVPDDRATPMNNNNLGGSYALVGSGHDCWKGVVVAHELLHTLGGLQASAPHATGGYHCNDGSDVMCYDDGTGRSRQRSVCAATMASRLDCNHDDYFSTAPPPGSYLATHWNAASSSFLYGGGPAAPRPPGPPRELTASPVEGRQSDGSRPDDVVLSWSAADGRVTGYRVSLPDGSAVTLPSESRSYTHRDAARGRACTYVVTALNEAGPGPAARVTVPARGLTELLRLR